MSSDYKFSWDEPKTNQTWLTPKNDKHDRSKLTKLDAAQLLLILVAYTSFKNQFQPTRI